jgi:hypothetical protein
VPLKYYLQQKQVTTASGSWEEYYDYSASGGALGYDIQTASYSTTTITTYNYMDCSSQTSWAGNAYTEFITYYSGTENYEDIRSSATIPDPSVDTWSDDTYEYAVADVNNVSAVCEGSTTTTTDQCVAPTYLNDLAQTGTGYDPSAFGFSDWFQQINETTTLQNEFTDAMLRSKTLASLPLFPPYWLIIPGNESFGAALYLLSDDHYYATAEKMQYRFVILPSVKSEVYKVEWDEVTTYPTGAPPSTQHFSEEVTGNGDPVNGAPTLTHTKDVPVIQSTIFVSGGTYSVVRFNPGGDIGNVNNF